MEGHNHGYPIKGSCLKAKERQKSLAGKNVVSVPDSIFVTNEKSTLITHFRVIKLHVGCIWRINLF